MKLALVNLGTVSRKLMELARQTCNSVSFSKVG
jgi:hypothetical protein